MASRRVFVCSPTWQDRQFQKQFLGLRKNEQDDFLSTLQALISALEVSPHPATDPLLRQTYKAKSYSGVVALQGATLIEYSLGPRSRVIAKFPARGEGDDDILLVTITLSHDHERMKRLIRDHRPDIDNWEDDESED